MNTRKFKDIIAQKVMFLLCIFVLSLTFLMAFGLYQRSKPIVAMKGLKDLLFSITWHPTQGHFGLASFLVGTLWVTGIAILIAVPLSILTAIYLSEYSHKQIREIARPVIDLLAGISPIIYGVWGIVAVVPIVRDYLMPFLSDTLPFFPFRSDNYTGFSALTGGIVLAVMVFPIVISIVGEVLRTIPFGIREVSLALGATKWQTVKYVVLKKAWPGIIAAIILGLSRALGETMAVLLVAGCALNVFPKSIFDPAYPLPALIANTYGEMMSIPLYDAAVLFAAFILLVVSTLFNIAGWGVLLRIERSEF
ncbi:MAG: phosphate ABC transporter permease subunit PstC [Candidatus Jettenia sp. CY-1]|nr:phosphate ABC transporter permease subunit PstC [Candidatus Jettenia sp.]WKZ19619.1 MAG: phosphate ABC transporter permease subunit PstC [Candidatus Jettenia sp. CY-1]